MNILRLLIKKKNKKKVSQTETRGTCVVQLIALMDVSAIRLSVLTMDNGRQRRLSNSHLWADATELIMNLSEIRPLFKYVSAGCPGCTRPRRIMWRQEPFSHLNRLLNPLFFPTFCEDFDSHGGSGTFLSNYAEKMSFNSQIADVTESKQWRRK